MSIHSISYKDVGCFQVQAQWEERWGKCRMPRWMSMSIGQWMSACGRMIFFCHLGLVSAYFLFQVCRWFELTSIGVLRNSWVVPCLKLNSLTYALCSYWFCNLVLIKRFIFSSWFQICACMRVHRTLFSVSDWLEFLATWYSSF